MARMTSDCLPHQVERTKTLFGYFVDNGSQHVFKVGGRPATLGLCSPALHASAHHSASFVCFVRTTNARSEAAPPPLPFHEGGRTASTTYAPTAHDGAHRPRRRPAPAANLSCPRRRHPTAAPSHSGRL